MKNVKRIMLGIVAIFAVVLLVACGAKSDNGTYKMELKYNIKGDELTFDLSKLSSSDQANLLFLKNAKLKRTK